jgi:hypothetical protein
MLLTSFSMPIKNSAPFFLPREHGAYIVLFASWIWGIIFSPIPDALGLTLVFAVAFHLFLIQESVRRSLRSRTRDLHPAVLAISAAAIAASIILSVKVPSILIIGIPALFLCILYFSLARKGAGPFARSALGFMLLSLVTPATIMASGSTDYLYLLFCWLSVAFFATSSVLVVGIRLGQPHAARRAMIFHFIYAIATIGAFVLTGMLLASLGIAAIAIVRYILVITGKVRFTMLPLKTVGMLESLVTAIALTVSALV